MVQRSHPLQIDVPLLGATHPSKEWLLSGLCVVALSVVAVQCAAVPRGTFTCDSVQVLSDELTRPEAEAYCRYAIRERRKVEGFWGVTWNEPIRIHVSRAYQISRALVQDHLGNRGLLEMPLRRTRENTGALLHMPPPQKDQGFQQALGGAHVWRPLRERTRLVKDERSTPGGSNLKSEGQRENCSRSAWAGPGSHVESHHMADTHFEKARVTPLPPAWVSRCTAGRSDYMSCSFP
jgi:hypothetical protein